MLLAPDKFKGSLDAVGVAAAVARGLAEVRPDVVVASVPVADGGDGTLAAASAWGFARVPVTVTGPTGECVETSYARRGSVAVTELADACGLGRLPSGTFAPLTASSRGLGEVIALAQGAGCREIIVGIGGSASTDGGSGLLGALGVAIYDSSGARLPDGGGPLADVARVDLSSLRDRVRACLGGGGGARLVVACDVDNPLTGPTGAAAVYGPQKGATPEEVALLDSALDRWADVVRAAVGVDHRARPGAGAAGGVGFATLAVLGAELRSGTDLMLDLVGFDEQLDGCDLVITGEGSLDEQTLHGKAPMGVAARARARDIPVVAVCGRCVLSAEQLRGVGIAASYSLLEIEPDQDLCLAEPARLLERVGAEIGRRHLT